MSSDKTLLFSWRWALLGSSLPPTARHVALTLSMHMDRAGECFPSIDTLAAETGLAYDSVRRTLRALEVAGWVERRVDHRGEGRGTRVHFTATTPTTGTESTGTQNTGTQNTGTRSTDHRDSASGTTGTQDPCQEVLQEDLHNAAAAAAPPSVDHDLEKRLRAAATVIADRRGKRGQGDDPAAYFNSAVKGIFFEELRPWAVDHALDGLTIEEIADEHERQHAKQAPPPPPKPAYYVPSPRTEPPTPMPADLKTRRRAS